MKNKHLIFLFAGLALCSASFGFALKEPAFKFASAATSKLTYDENNKITLGSFGQTYNETISQEAQADFMGFIEKVDSTKVEKGQFIRVTYKNSTYFIRHLSVDLGDPNNERLSTGTAAKDVNGDDGVFNDEPLKWVKYSEGDGYVDFISDRVIIRDVYNDTSIEKLSYKDSTLCYALNEYFYNIAFSDKDKTYLSDIGFEGKDLKVVIPDMDKIREGEPKADRPTDYAICSQLSVHEGYDHAPYWTTETSRDSYSRKVVRWYDKSETDCLLYDAKIGVRPIIRIKSSLLGGVKKTSSVSTPTNVNVALILGIITGVLGAGAVITFLILWSKKLKLDPTFKAPGWYYAIIFIATACCSISVISLSVDASGGGGGLGGTSFKYGYYVQTGVDSGNINGIGYVQVGSTAWLFKSDGTCSYTGYLEDTKNASDFSPDNYMTGTFKISGSKLTASIPERTIQNFGKIGGTFNFTIKGGDRLYQNGRETYHWVRGE